MAKTYDANFREQVAEILVKWSLPTRQVAIIELVQLHEQYMQAQLVDIQEYVKKKLKQRRK